MQQIKMRAAVPQNKHRPQPVNVVENDATEKQEPSGETGGGQKKWLQNTTIVLDGEKRSLPIKKKHYFAWTNNGAKQTLISSHFGESCCRRARKYCDVKIQGGWGVHHSLGQPRCSCNSRQSHWDLLDPRHSSHDLNRRYVQLLLCGLVGDFRLSL